MKLNYDEEQYKIINGSNLEVLDTISDNSISSIVTDAPYELGFMGKKWDSTGIAYNVELWKKCLRVIKPGGYMLVFGGSRTFHRIAVAIEDAGFEIRDTMMYLYGCGFPKSLNIGLAIDKKNGVESKIVGEANYSCPHYKDLYKPGVDAENKRVVTVIKEAQNKWNGWMSQLKPAFEPIIVARKPCEGTITDNVLKWGVGGLNIDECRVDYNGGDKPQASGLGRNKDNWSCFGLPSQEEKWSANDIGRFPSNVITDGSEEVAAGLPIENGKSALRYFYCAKASKKDRDDGLDNFESKQMYYEDRRGNSFDIFAKRGENGEVKNELRKNIHPTVKPVELMQYLVRLVTPKGGTVLDIFNGSGSTGKAVAFENRERESSYKYIGIELEKEYCEISKARINYAVNKYEYDMMKDIKDEEEKTGQMSLFDF